MSESVNLWVNSRLCNGLLLVNLGLSAIVFFFGPWSQVPTKSVSTASYTAPTLNASTNSRQSLAGRASTMHKQGGASIKRAIPMWDYDATLTRNNLTTQFLYPADTKLHIVGVYEAEKVKVSPDWGKCIAITDESLRKECTFEAQRKARIMKKKPGTINVNITDTAPIVLVLSAYDSVNWNINAASTTNIQRVILGGYHSQTIQGLSSNIPVDAYTHSISACRYCISHANSFYVYKNNGTEFENKLNQITSIAGLSATSFQGAYKAKAFSISALTNTPLNIAARNNPVVDKKYKGKIELNNGVVNLPEGEWDILSYSVNAFKNNNTEVMVLGDINEGRLNGLVVAIFQENTQAFGYAKKAGCDNKNVYYNQMIQNKDKGKQKCYWVDYVSGLWEQPAFNEVTKQLYKMKIRFPNIFLNAAYHKADKDYSQTVYYLKNPSKKSKQTNTIRQKKYWQADVIEERSDLNEIVKDYVATSKYWFQILDAI